MKEKKKKSCLLIGSFQEFQNYLFLFIHLLYFDCRKLMNSMTTMFIIFIMKIRNIRTIKVANLKYHILLHKHTTQDFCLQSYHREYLSFISVKISLYLYVWQCHKYMFINLRRCSTNEKSD